MHTFFLWTESMLHWLHDNQTLWMLTSKTKKKVSAQAERKEEEEEEEEEERAEEGVLTAT